MSLTFAQALGAVLRERREASGLSQTEGAQLFGTAQSTMSRWEAGLVLPDLNAVLRGLGVEDTISLLQLVEARYPELAPIGGRVVLGSGPDAMLSTAALAELLRQRTGT